MLNGNPFLFSIGWLHVEEWSLGNSSQELFFVYAGGRLVAGSVAEAHSVGAQLSNLLVRCNNHLHQKEILPNIKILGDAEIYSWLLKLTFPGADGENEESYEFLAAPYAVTDKNEILFLVKGLNSDKIFHGYFDGKLIGVTDIPCGEFARVVDFAWNDWNFEKDNKYLPSSIPKK